MAPSTIQNAFCNHQRQTSPLAGGGSGGGAAAAAAAAAVPSKERQEAEARGKAIEADHMRSQEQPVEQENNDEDTAVPVCRGGLGSASAAGQGSSGGYHDLG